MRCGTGMLSPTNWDKIYQARLVDFTLATKPMLTLAKNVLAILSPTKGRSELALLTSEDVSFYANI